MSSHDRPSRDITRRLTGTRPLRVLCVAAALGLGATTGLTGCAPYITYPASESGTLAQGNVNAQPGPIVMRQSLVRVISEDRAAGDATAVWGINLPQGMRQVTARIMRDGVASAVGSEGLLVGEPGFENARMYSVTRVWVRGDDARVDIVRPDGSGTGAYKRSTVNLRGPFGQWDVESVFDWDAGLTAEPELFGWREPAPATDADDDADPALSGGEEG